MKRTLLCASALSILFVLALALKPVYAAPAMKWENKWYPVPDGRDNKLYIRFGINQKTGQRCRQWGNGYDHKIRLDGRVYYQGAGPGQPNPKRTFFAEDWITLEKDERSDDGLNLTMDNEPYLGAVAKVQDK